MCPFTTNVREEAIENANKRDYLRVRGNWNTRIGGDTIPNEKDVVGGYSNTSERGQKALEFVERHKVVIADRLSQLNRRPC